MADLGITYRILYVRGGVILLPWNPNPDPPRTVVHEQKPGGRIARGSEIGVTEVLMDGSEVNAFHDHMGSKGVSQCVEGALRDAGFLDRYVEAAHNLETFGAELVGLS